MPSTADAATAPAQRHRTDSAAHPTSESMSVTTALFYVFAAILVFAALRVVTARNPVHAALWLVLAFFTAAAHWLMLRAEFLAIVLVLVYVGAVMVLFLFVVMMLDVNFDVLRKEFRSYLPVGTAVGVLVVVEMALVLVSNRLTGVVGGGAAVVPGGSNTRALGELLYTEYVYPFEIAAVILLVAIIAAIVLTHRERRTSRHQDPGLQVKVRAKDRLRVLSMPPEKKEG
jgi:NADH-quinone oxidoreductase subunit J